MAVLAAFYACFFVVVWPQASACFYFSFSVLGYNQSMLGGVERFQSEQQPPLSPQQGKITLYPTPYLQSISLPLPRVPLNWSINAGRQLFFAKFSAVSAEYSRGRMATVFFLLKDRKWGKSTITTTNNWKLSDNPIYILKSSFIWQILFIVFFIDSFHLLLLLIKNSFSKYI